MRRYTDITILHAQEIRKKNFFSYAQLSKVTGIPSSTIRNWCQNEYIGTKRDVLLSTNERKRKILKKLDNSALNSLRTISPDIAKILLSIIYWCEGSKYPATNKVDVVNSDPNLLKIFISLLRKAYALDESKFRVHLQIHNTHDYNNIKQFWSNTLQIPTSQFMKPTVTFAKGGKHRKTYKGTCTVRYIDFRIQLRLIGLYERFTEKFVGLLNKT